MPNHDIFREFAKILTVNLMAEVCLFRKPRMTTFMNKALHYNSSKLYVVRDRQTRALYTCMQLLKVESLTR